MNALHIYTDGSCIGNPGPGGWGVVILGEEEIYLSDSEPGTTNNRMEMLSVIRAMEYVKKNFPNQKKLKIHTDSRLVQMTMTAGWKRKSNLDLWIEIEKLIPSFDIEWVKVKAHADDKYNNIADELAQKAARSI